MASEGEIRWVGHLQRCDVKPGDKFVLSVDQHISDETARHINDAWKEKMGDVDLFILMPGMKLGVFGDAKD